MGRALIVIVAVGVIAGGEPHAAQQPSMTAHYIAVGQAHSTLLEFPCGAMLVDVGAQDEDHQTGLIDYLEEFFKRRTDLDRTLESILLTHNHIDHTATLDKIVETFTVRRFVHSGMLQGPGRRPIDRLFKNMPPKLIVREVGDDEIEAVAAKTGLSDSEIDPVNCADVDPQIRILHARLDDNPGWDERSFDNQNNHSLVTRIDFGDASYLFMGDLETEGIELLLDYYNGATRSMLNVDVLQVGHHGSHNATTPALAWAVSPIVSVIPVGRWTFGRGQPRGFNTFSFGHPRRVAVEMLLNVTQRTRPSKQVFMAEGARSFKQATISKAVYATGWDGNIRVIGSADGKFRVLTDQ